MIETLLRPCPPRLRPSARRAVASVRNAEDERDYTVAAQMLRALGVSRLDLLSNNPDKAVQLAQLDLEVASQLPTAVHLSSANARYLATKRDHTAHTLDLPLAG